MCPACAAVVRISKSRTGTAPLSDGVKAKSVESAVEASNCKPVVALGLVHYGSQNVVGQVHELHLFRHVCLQDRKFGRDLTSAVAYNTCARICVSPRVNTSKLRDVLSQLTEFFIRDCHTNSQARSDAFRCQQLLDCHHFIIGQITNNIGERTRSFVVYWSSGRLPTFRRFTAALPFAKLHRQFSPHPCPPRAPPRMLPRRPP